MTSHAEKMSHQNSKTASRIFYIYFAGYIVLFTATVYWVTSKLGAPVWFWFAIGIGSIYVFIAFYYFYDNYLQPYIIDLEKAANEDHENTAMEGLQSVRMPQSVHLWTLEWVTPAIMVQFLVVVFFWLTVSTVPFKQTMFTHPFMYGQVYEKMKNHMSPEIEIAGSTKKLGHIDLDKEEKSLNNRARFLEQEFAGYLKTDTGKKEDLNNDQKNIHATSNVVAVIYEIPYFIALTFAFLGTLMYTLNDIVYRFFISDLYPKTFVSYTVWFLFAPAICLVIAYFFMNNWLINGGPIIFFLIGFFPQMALQYIEEKTRERLKLRKEDKKEIPLGLIQGMTDYNIYRLKELGVGDAQNLAYSDINYLRKNWYNDRQLGNFISQAMLLIHLREDFLTLQNSGIRNIIAFKHVVKDKASNQEECDQFAKNIGIAKDKLLTLCNLINMSPTRDRIETLESLMRKFDEKERRKLT